MTFLATVHIIYSLVMIIELVSTGGSSSVTCASGFGVCCVCEYNLLMKNYYLSFDGLIRGADTTNIFPNIDSIKSISFLIWLNPDLKSLIPPINHI